MIKWGIIGCGEVTEVKSGPAFNKVNDSALVAVMRRQAHLAADYARRHGVPRWYDNAEQLIHDPEVNAIYIATPPDSHEQYAIQALEAGKPVYVEKPMTLDAAAARRLAEAVDRTGVKLVVAHYRRAQPLYQKLKQLISEAAIGQVQWIRLNYTRHLLNTTEMNESRNAWRVNPAIAGGGLYHDLAPHQLDILLYLFGSADHVQGYTLQQSGAYAAPDVVTGSINWPGGLFFTGTWYFNLPASQKPDDSCTLIGTDGEIRFSFFGKEPLELRKGDELTRFEFPPLPHVQQPMISQVVDYLMNRAGNPCPVSDGLQVMEWIDKMTG